MREYRVETDVYSGPMGLLLYLIKRDEIDLYDIPVSQITKQYCEYVDMLRVIDPNIAGDFLVMATVLMELKSRLLLPHAVTEDGEPEDLADPRMELVRQLLEYKKFKDASFELGRAVDLQERRWPRKPARIKPPDVAEVDLDEVQIWDLVAAFNKVMSAIGAGQSTHDVVFDDTPLSVHAADILDRLQNGGGEMTFEQIFLGRSKVEMIGLFLALLELMRQSRVRATQAGTFDTVAIVLLSAEPIEIGEEWGEAFAEAVLGGDAATHEGDAAEPPQPPFSPTASGATEATESQDFALAEGLPENDSEDLEDFSELDDIKVDVDIDAILKHGERGHGAGDRPGDPEERTAP